MRAVALLRGMNIGRVRVPMRELADALTGAGFAGVRTVLASGNVVLTAETDEPKAIAGDVAAVLRRDFGLDLAVIVVSVPVVRTAVEEYPFPRAEDRHAYVMFAEDPAALAELLESAQPLDPEVERVQPGEGVLYWDAPKGRTLSTAFGLRYSARQRSGAVTTRNLKTLEKILDVA
jgi:uncharacterized protein (DUF1697 family)